MVQNKTVLNVYKAYYDCLRVRKLKDVASMSVYRLKSHVKDAKAFYDAGLIPKNDLLSSELELAQGRQDLLQCQNATLLAFSVLNVMMKRPVDAPLVIGDITTCEKREIEWSDVCNRAGESRPEILQAYKRNPMRSERMTGLARKLMGLTTDFSATYA
ncbi:MAG: TolC family protein, partial [Desulfobulbaceae bacterium]|nr:TolC family protein [Desulfobulbaceae bacterium]